ncbi:hypothetical protein OIU34_22270 [Pararhizobium sp. BT-229]|uniref:hypothetical protein n=1 Tax=Pararhizobium sp. BT-229 TaxID=2986923 RepID=UPI0021F7D2FE|nr:hypothetical protein [Pararhizobium sp. BT-229]MCV9964620.1 hypothetical protein [Pararhizobium sp. BT-229]
MATAKPTPAPNANRQNIDLVIDAIRNPGNFFSMKQFWVDPDFLTCLDDALFLKVYGAAKPPAATPACIAGWANSIAGNHLKDERGAAEFLGLAFPAESEKLFRPRLERYKDVKYDLSHVTREETIEALERLVATGQIDWSEDPQAA